MRRVAGRLLELGGTPRWLTLLVGAKGDLRDYRDAGARRTDLSALVAAAPPAYQVVVPVLREGLAASTDDRAEIAELRQERAALLEENRELRRQAPQKALRRLVQSVADLESDASTRGMAWPLLALLSERQERMEAGEPGDTAIPWNGAERRKRLGRSETHLRTKFIAPLKTPASSTATMTSGARARPMAAGATTSACRS